jgi:hypothetical protein
VSEEKKIMPKAKVRKEEITSLERQALEGLSPDYRMMGIGIAIGAPVGAVVSLIICWYIWGLPLFLRLFV